MISSILTPIASGSFMTLALLYAMQLLIAMTPAEGQAPRDRAELAFVRVADPVDPPTVIAPPIDRHIADPPPAPPALPPGTPNESSLAVPSLPSQEPGRYKPPPGLTLADGPLVSLVLVRPSYPPAAAAKGLEGQVLLQFDVGVDGSVSNVVVVESSHKVFESSAIKAATRFRYKPRVVDGVAIATPAVRTLLTFRLE